MKRRSSYKVTLFDRHGPGGVIYLKAFGRAAFAVSISLPMFGLAGYKLGLGVGALIAFTLISALTLGASTLLVALAMAEMGGQAAMYIATGGSGIGYDEQFSHEQALVMQREYALALASFEQRIAAAPNEPRVRIAAADLYASHGENPRRAAELYREVQRIPKVMSGHDVYASNRLVDLYIGPLNEPGKALVELRRLIDRYPDSKVAEQARMGLANLKSHLVPDARTERGLRAEG